MVELGLAIGAAAAALVWGTVEIARGAWRIGRLTVRVELDASRRWVTLRSVHPRFAAAANQTDAVHATP